jgi:hypothetical protein
MMVINGLPPALGNVCVGILETDLGRRTFTLKHVTRNDPDGQLIPALHAEGTARGTRIGPD